MGDKFDLILYSFRMVENNDVVGKTVGDFGKWQLRTILIIFLCKIPTSWFMAVVIYTAPQPNIGEHWCRPPEYFKPPSPVEWMQIAHPWRNGTDKLPHMDVCHVYKDVYDNPHMFFGAEKNESIVAMLNRTIIPCTSFVFDSDFHSLIAEFNLICSKALLLNLSQCFHIFGLLCGGILAYMMLKA